MSPRQILFVQGAGAAVHDQWDDKLVASLTRSLGDEYSILYPRMPDEADPRYAAWKAALLTAFEALDDGAVLVGHSVGGTVLLHLLAEAPPPFMPGMLILIAPPFIGKGGWSNDDVPHRTDFSQSLPPALPVRIYHGSDDTTVPAAHMKLYAKAIPQAVVVTLPHRDHQLNAELGEIAREIRGLPRQSHMKSG